MDEGSDAELDEFADTKQEENKEFQEKDCILFVIDARPPMLEATGDAEPPLVQALTCVANCMRDRILGGDQDLVGVLLFGTEHAKAPEDQQSFPNTFVLQEPSVPSATSMRELQLLLQSRQFGAFGHLPQSHDFELANVLWMVAILFGALPKAKSIRRRVFLVTNDEDPCRGSIDKRKRALLRATDLQDAHVQLEPFFFANSSRSFDLSDGSFWRTFVTQVRTQVAKDDDDDEVEEGDAWVKQCVCADEAELRTKVKRHQHRKRSYASVDLHLSADQVLAVQLVTLVKPFSKPSAQKVDARTNEPLLSEKTTMCSVHATVLQASDLYKAWEFGGHWVYFEAHEIKQMMKDLGGSGLHLLGFKPVDRLKPYHNLRPAVFLEASEKKRPGSATALESLVVALHKLEKIAICRFIRNSGPRLVALLPQLRDVDPETQVVHLPAGFHMVQLPWADQVRAPELPAPLTASDFTPQQLDATLSLVRGLSLPPGAASDISNPSAHRHFAFIQHIAVPGSKVEPTIDGSQPNEAVLAQHADEAQQFIAAFNVDPNASAASGERAPKRPRAAAVEAPTSDADWLELYQSPNGTAALAKLTVALLKEFCKKHGLAVSGKKDDLLSRVIEQLTKIAAEDSALRQAKVDNEGT